MSECRHELPFRVDPTEKRVTHTVKQDGAHFAHVDLAKCKKAQRQRVVVVDRNKRSGNKSPGHMHVDHSTIDAAPWEDTQQQAIQIG